MGWKYPLIWFDLCLLCLNDAQTLSVFVREGEKKYIQWIWLLTLSSFCFPPHLCPKDCSCSSLWNQTCGYVAFKKFSSQGSWAHFDLYRGSFSKVLISFLGACISAQITYPRVLASPRPRLCSALPSLPWKATPGAAGTSVTPAEAWRPPAWLPSAGHSTHSLPWLHGFDALHPSTGPVFPAPGSPQASAPALARVSGFSILAFPQPVWWDSQCWL